jgi:hypothetical protein
MTTDNDEMTRGYMDGFDDDRLDLPESSNYTQQYMHGWRNGRDDRLGVPRAPACHLREKAQELISEDL